jgi:hypothetical protein
MTLVAIPFAKPITNRLLPNYLLGKLVRLRIGGPTAAELPR